MEASRYDTSEWRGLCRKHHECTGWDTWITHKTQLLILVFRHCIYLNWHQSWLLNTINIFNNMCLQKWNSLFLVFLNSGFTTCIWVLLQSLQLVGTGIQRNKRGYHMFVNGMQIFILSSLSFFFTVFLSLNNNTSSTDIFLIFFIYLLFKYPSRIWRMLLAKSFTESYNVSLCLKY